jgi:hypothetical protein
VGFGFIFPINHRKYAVIFVPPSNASYCHSSQRFKAWGLPSPTCQTFRGCADRCHIMLLCSHLPYIFEGVGGSRASLLWLYGRA